MNYWFSLLALLALSANAKAQHAGHSEYHDVYKHWMQPFPNSNSSCCREKKIKKFQDGSSIEGDCYPTIFNLINGQRWIAKLDEHDSIRFRKEWIDVPDSSLIREKNPDLTGTRGHICIGGFGQVLCAVPPSGAI